MAEKRPPGSEKGGPGQGRDAPATDLFRRVLRWVDEQTELVTLTREFMEEPLFKGVGWPHVFGSAALFLFINQVCTGILLAVYYVPSPDGAWQSVSYINGQVPLGSVIRGLHHWGASAMLIIVFVHMLQVFFWGAYKRPRQIIWVVGVFLLLMTLGLSFTGYLLPWDQKAYWATVVGTRIAGTVPLVGYYITTLVRGEANIGALTLTRFFGLHVMIFPALLAGLIIFHVSQVRRKGITAPWKRVGDEETVPRTGLFYPDQVFRDVVVSLLVLGGLFAMALLRPAPLETIANPTSTGYTPRPEWYFLPNFELLKHFPASWGEWGEFAGAIVVPTVAVLALLVLPYVDHNPERVPQRRPLVTTAAIISLVLLLYLGSAAREERASSGDPFAEGREGREGVPRPALPIMPRHQWWRWYGGSRPGAERTAQPGPGDRETPRSHVQQPAVSHACSAEQRERYRLLQPRLLHLSDRQQVPHAERSHGGRAAEAGEPLRGQLVFQPQVRGAQRPLHLWAVPPADLLPELSPEPAPGLASQRLAQGARRRLPRSAGILPGLPRPELLQHLPQQAPAR